MNHIEAQIEKDSVKLAESEGWLSRKLQWVGRRGAPDRVFLKGSRAVFIEFKRPGVDVTGQQYQEFSRLVQAYDEVYVARSVEDVERILGI